MKQAMQLAAMFNKQEQIMSALDNLLDSDRKPKYPGLGTGLDIFKARLK